jgi:hypothetical protein
LLPGFDGRLKNPDGVFVGHTGPVVCGLKE